MRYAARRQTQKVAVLCKDRAACILGEREMRIVRSAYHAPFGHRNDVKPASPQTVCNRIANMFV